MARFIIIGISLIAALGGLIYGIDAGQFPFGRVSDGSNFCLGIIGTTLGQEPFKLYMYGPSKSNPPITGMC